MHTVEVCCVWGLSLIRPNLLPNAMFGSLEGEESRGK